MVFEKKSYSWGLRKFNVSPEVVGKVFEGLESEYGGVTDRNFLDASRPENSPTHKLFEWNDTKAAENYRLCQSRTVINNLKITVISDEWKKPKTVNAVVNVSETSRDGSARYVNVGYALSDLNSRNVVLNRALSELRTFKRKYDTLRELARVISAIDVVLGTDGEQNETD